MKGAKFSWRLEHWLGQTRLMQAVSRAANSGRLHWIPPWPKLALKRWGTEPSYGPKPLAIPGVPAKLQGLPGTKRDPALEDAAFARGPLPELDQWIPVARTFTRDFMWLPRLLSRPRITRALRMLAARKVRTKEAVTPEALALSPEELTRRVKAKAAELGISAIGIAEYNEKYIWEPELSKRVGDRIIVVVLEQDYEATQTAPSLRSERAALAGYGGLYGLAIKLSDYLRELGYTVREGDASGIGPSIYYGVEAGLGQMGLNGQLLTPFAGSRIRSVLINTDAPLVLDRPVDYGIPQLCDACQVCVRRCPTGAIPSVRKYHRGVEKAKIKIERCLPIVSQVHGCAVCMKTCPVQKYGLPAVLTHFAETGEVLGKGSDELEGYVWPIDGRRYGPGEKPRSAITKELLEPGGRQVKPVIPWPD